MEDIFGFLIWDWLEWLLKDFVSILFYLISFFLKLFVGLFDRRDDWKLFLSF